MVSFYIIQNMMAAAYKVHVSVFMKQLLTSKLLFSAVNTSFILSCVTVLHGWVVLNHIAKYIAPSVLDFSNWFYDTKKVHWCDARYHFINQKKSTVIHVGVPEAYFPIDALFVDDGGCYPQDNGYVILC